MAHKQAPTLDVHAGFSIKAGATVTIASSVLAATDNVSDPAQLTDKFGNDTISTGSGDDFVYGGDGEVARSMVTVVMNRLHAGIGAIRPRRDRKSRAGSVTLKRHSI